MSDMPNIPADNARQSWFQEVWRSREEKIYPQLFGSDPDGIFRMTDEIIRQLGQKEIDPRWKTISVLRFCPDQTNAECLYVTSGLSTPWGLEPGQHKADDFSGLGFEFFMRFSEKADFAATVLLWLAAVQTLVACGLLRGELVEALDRVPLGRPLAEGSLLDTLFIFQPADIPSAFELQSGRVDLFCVTGITTMENGFAKSQGGDSLLTLLRHHDADRLTNIRRASVV